MRNSRENRRIVYLDNATIFRDGYYTNRNGEEIELSPKDAILYREEVPMSNHQTLNTKILCEEIDTVTMARRLVRQGKRVLVLNMASAFHACGGYDRGAGSQEECLCRSSTLPMTLYAHYDSALAEENGVEMTSRWYPLERKHGAIFSTETFFRDKNMELMDEPFDADVITIGALNFRDGGKNDRRFMSPDGGFTDEGRKVMESKIRSIFRIALAHGDTTLVLGAFGCGAYRLRDDLVAKMFHDILHGEFQGAFDTVAFAIYGDVEKHRPFFELFG